MLPIAQPLQEGFPVRVPFRASRLFQEAIAGFLLFLETKTIAERMEWTLDPYNISDPDDGYILKQRTNGGDDKDIFHYRPHLLHLLRARDVVLTSQEMEWLKACDNLYRHSLALMLMYVDRLADDLGDPRLLMNFIKGSEGPEAHCLRLLAYKPHPDSLAQEHVDRDFLTLHIGESHPGLVFPNVSETIMPSIPESGILFTGIKAELETKLLRPARHKVVATDTETRYSAVFFGHTDLVVDPVRVPYAQVENLRTAP